jgi:hypothetical protein
MTTQEIHRDRVIPTVSGGDREHGHREEMRTDPVGLMQRVRDECGDVGAFDLAGRRTADRAPRSTSFSSALKTRISSRPRPIRS